MKIKLGKHIGATLAGELDATRRLREELQRREQFTQQMTRALVEDAGHDSKGFGARLEDENGEWVLALIPMQQPEAQ